MSAEFQLTVNEYTKFWRDASYDNMELLHANFITHTFTRHYHEEYVVGVIERNAYEFYHRGGMQTISEGEIVLINPGEIHSGRPLYDSGWTYRVFYPTVTLMRRIACEMTGKPWDMPYFPDSVVDDPYLAQQILSLHLLMEHSQSRLARDTQLRVALATLISRYAVNRPLNLAMSNEPRAIKRVQDYLETHYADNVSLDELAQVAALSPYHLVRIFKQETGLPPHQYLAHLRVLRAKSLLTAGMAIRDVAASTGFTDQSHLTRWFKRVIGIPPGKYAG